MIRVSWGGSFRIHPRDKQDVAYRLTLGARAVAYGEVGVSFQGPFPTQITLLSKMINVTYDQKVRVTPSKDVFEVKPALAHSFFVFHIHLLDFSTQNLI